MKTKLIISLSMLIISLSVFSADDKNNEALNSEHQTIAIQGTIQDALTGELLPGVSVKIDGIDKTYFTDFNGKYNIESIEPGQYTITYSYISYQTVTEENIEIKNNEMYNKNLKMDMIK